jgi:superfamily I DNA/RNA helicase
LGLVRASESLSHLPKEMPFSVPTGYFDKLDEKIMEMIRSHPDYQTSGEELESISPLLSSISKRPVYSVPEGYFENFKSGVEEKKEARVVSITNRKWFRYAAAAVITGVVLMAGFIAFKNDHKDSATTTLAKFEKEVRKINDVKSTENLIDFMDAGLNEKELARSNKGIKTDDIQLLLKDVSIDELRDFSEESKDIEDVMMTN